MANSPVFSILRAAGFSAYLRGFSAIDSWLNREAGSGIHVLTSADTADLARLFEALRYPGIGLADAALDGEEQTYYFYCVDSEKTALSGQSNLGHALGHPFPIDSRRASFSLLEFYQDCITRTFYDPLGMYPLLSGIRKDIRGPAAAASTDDTVKARPGVPEILKESLNPGVERARAVMDAALIVAKYFPNGCTTQRQIERIAELLRGLPDGPAPGQEEQRIFLIGLLTSPNPGPGFELLKSLGFIREFWPELAVLDDVDHSKEFHPEGNVWKHTMETFRYRKTGQRGAYDLRLSLGLLLHDAGKPAAESTGSHRFNGHAELGEVQARRFLERLGFGAPLVRDVCYLVKNHMLPAALPRLPLFRTGEIMASPLFPVLMELYRCDESSSFKGLGGYYESSAAYQSYLRNRRNPYRSADGKKLKRERMGTVTNAR